MCGGSNNQNTSSLIETLELILMLQQKGENCDIANGCSKPFLGPNPSEICLNTRPINIYSCCNNTLWAMPYTSGTTTATSSVFRIENLEDNCATFRVLAPNTDVGEATLFPYITTDDFFTINLDCIGVLKCLADTYVSGI